MFGDADGGVRGSKVEGWSGYALRRMAVRVWNEDFYSRMKSALDTRHQSDLNTQQTHELTFRSSTSKTSFEFGGISGGDPAFP